MKKCANKFGLKYFINEQTRKSEFLFSDGLKVKSLIEKRNKQLVLINGRLHGLWQSPVAAFTVSHGSLFPFG